MLSDDMEISSIAVESAAPEAAPAAPTVAPGPLKLAFANANQSGLLICLKFYF